MGTTCNFCWINQFEQMIAVLLYINKIEDIKGVIRIRISKKNGQHNGQ